MKQYIKTPIGILSAVVVGIVILIGGWLIMRPSGSQIESIEVKRGSIAQSVNVTGRVKPVSAVDLAFKQSGKISKILVVEGDRVYAGEVLAQLDASSAEGSVRDAEVNLENAKLTLEKINLQHAQQLRGDTLNKNYEAGLGTLANFYGGFAATLDALDKIFFGTNLSDQLQQNNIEYYASYKIDFATAPVDLKKLYLETEDLYQQGLTSYQTAQRGSGESRDQAIEQGYELTVKTAQMIKTGRNVIRSLTDTILQDGSVHAKKTIIDSHAIDLANYAATTDSYLQDLLTDINAINSERDTLETYPLDRESQELTIKQRENALRDAKDRLADYFIRSPIIGIVTKQDGKAGEIIAGNIKIISLISDAALEIEANIPEVDIGKIRVNNPVIINLDALPDKNFKGAVSFIDPAETVVDGVVNFKIKISFSENTELVKSGLTANLVIETIKKDNVIVLPQFAIVEKDGGTFVRKVQDSVTKDVPVQLGIRGEDGSAEIISGVSEGETVLNVAKATQ